MKKMIKNGFSMVELMVILAALGGVALIVTRLGKNSMDIQNETQSAADYADLVRSVHFLLGDSDSCKATLSGKKISSNDLGKEIPGLDLYFAEAGQTGSQQDKQKKIIQGNNGKLTIDKISLTVSAYPGHKNIAGTKALIKLSGIKSSKPVKTFEEIRHPLFITLKKDPASDEMFIVNCERFDSDSLERARVWCGTVNTPCLSGQRVMALGKFAEGKFTGVVHALESNSSFNCPALIEQSAQLAECGNQ